MRRVVAGRGCWRSWLRALCSGRWSRWRLRIRWVQFALLPASTAYPYESEGAAAALKDGRVLVVGGRDALGSWADTYELFDPVTQTFAQLPGVTGSPWTITYPGDVAAPLPDGEVLITGGNDAGPLLPTGDSIAAAWLFDPTSDVFTQLPASGDTELQTSRSGAVAAPLPDGEVLIAGGVHLVSGGNSAGVVLASAELFDPATDTFTALPASGASELLTARAGAVATPLPGGDVLIAGGTNSSGQLLQSAELFDPSTDTFAGLPASGDTQLQTARSGAIAAPLPDGEVLIAGGRSTTAPALQSAEIFDPHCDTFTALPASGNTELQEPRVAASAAPLADGQVLIVGSGPTTPGPPSGYTYGGTAELFSEGTPPPVDTGCVPPQLLTAPPAAQPAPIAASIPPAATATPTTTQVTPPTRSTTPSVVVPTPHLVLHARVLRIQIDRHTIHIRLSIPAAASGVHCALIRAGATARHLHRCDRTQTFYRLRAGRYLLLIRAVGPADTQRPLARHSITIP